MKHAFREKKGKKEEGEIEKNAAAYALHQGSESSTRAVADARARHNESGRKKNDCVGGVSISTHDVR